MKITAVNSYVNFGRQLNPGERKDMKEIGQKAFAELGHADGKRIFIMPDNCLPQYSQNDTGIGIISSKASQEFFSTMDDYLNYTHLEILPFGKPDGFNNFFSNYSSTVMTPGVQHVNLELLKEDDFGKILSEEEYREVIKKNFETQDGHTKRTLINNHNIFDDNSPQDTALRKAYERFKTSDNPKIADLKADFAKFKTKNKDWLDIYSVYYGVLQKEHGYQWFQKWDEDSVDRNLYNKNFSEDKRKARLNQIFTENADEIEFYNFKQFIAEKHFLIGKENLNKLGKKLITDCPITFDDALVHAFPDAFMPHPIEIGWGLPMFNYTAIENPKSDASKLLMRKIERNAELGDCIRMDVGWQYFQAAAKYPDKTIYKKDFGETLLNRIEETVRRIKGRDFDTNNIIYEFDSDPNVFTPFENDKLKPAVRRAVKVYNVNFVNDNWGTNEAFTRLFGQDRFVAGINHDPENLTYLAKDLPITAKYEREKHIKALAKFFHVSENSIRNPIEFYKAKLAEITSAKNHMHFYMNIFARPESFQRDNIDNTRTWGYRAGVDYEKELNKAIQSGYGYNLMDSLEKLFKRAGLDKTKKEIYDKIVYYRDELYKADEVLTETEKPIENALENGKKSLSHSKLYKTLLVCFGTIGAAGLCTYLYLSNNKKPKSNDLKQTAQPVTNASNQYQNFAKPSSFLHS